MAIMVTGGAGYIGSQMSHELTDAGEQVVVLDDLSTGLRAAVPDGAAFVEGKVQDEALVSRVLEQHAIDAVIHFAGSIIVPESVAKPLDYYLNNTAATAHLLRACVAGGVSCFIFSSTAAVYGEPDVVPTPEDAPLEPTSPYGSSKMMTELMLRDVHRAHGLRYGILRYFNVAGADPRGRTGQRTAEATHLIKVASQVALGLRPRLGIFGDDYPTADGTGVRDYIHVQDLVTAHRLALRHLRQGGDCFTANCGYGRGYSVREVVAAIEEVVGHPIPVAVEARRPGDPATLVAQCDRVRRLLGWTPKYDDLVTIVRHALDWERSYAPTR